jgi:hypothetical protein
MPVMVRLARRQLSRNAPEFGHECFPQEQMMRPFGFSLTVHGWSPCFPQKGHMALVLSWMTARTVAHGVWRAQKDRFGSCPARGSVYHPPLVTRAVRGA